MLPISLTIEGLYSYKESQTIDFERLTSNQIFGIFGEVGSGKSSILEAIVFALYGETDRLKNRNENRHYNMMNLQSNRLLIDFHCKTGHKSQEEYRFIFEAKRNSKNFEDVKATGKGRRVFKKIAGEWQPLENWNAEEIIGMDYGNFRQTIIIPQGKFREFIEQTPMNRTKMLQAIFKLDAFDLADKTKKLFYKNDAALGIKRALLEKLEAFTKARISELANELKTTETEQKTLKITFSEKQEALLVQKKNQQLHKEAAVQKVIFEKFETQRNAFLSREKILEQYKKAFTYFNEKFIQQEQLQQEAVAKNQQIADFKKQEIVLNKEIEKAEKAFSEAEKNYQNRDIDKKKCEELKKIIASLTLKNQLAAKETEVQKMNAILISETQVVENYELENSKISNEISELKKQLPKNITLLLEQKNNFATAETLQKNKHLLEGKVSQNHANILKFITQKTVILERLQIVNKESFSFEKILDFIKSKTEKITKENRSISTKIQDLKVRQKLSSYSEALENGNPCPLCGSLEHPEIAHIENVNSELKALLQQQKNNETALQKLSKSEKELIKLSANFEIEKNSEATLFKEFSEAEKLWKSHLKKFSKQKFTEAEKEKLEAQILLYNKNSEAIKSLEKDSEERKIKLENIRKNLATKQELIQIVRNEVLKLTTQIETSLADISLLKELLSKPKSVLEKSLIKGEKQISEAEKNHKSTSKNLQELKEKITHLSATLEAVIQQETTLSETIKTLETNILNLLESYNFENISEIKSLLKKKISIETEQENITNFKQELALANQKYENLKTKIGNQPFDETLFKQLEIKVQELDNQRTLNEKKVAVLGQEIKNIELKLIEKKALETALSQLSERAENLKTLQSLFKGAGFVDYISVVYLRNLVAVANERFVKLTRNNLSLELDSENNFAIRDYLNDGKTRLLKTLSGGQMFQAALCLALALAESVRTLNQSDKSFFFLDEGFGTLDKAALQTVFQTLKSLKKENRIVGIISHVEELQQEVEVSLKVNNDKEKGSLISYSWE